jgi:transglutaminase-like putative cysteine protease
MSTALLRLAFACAFLSPSATALAADAPKAVPTDAKSRTFLFTYCVIVTGLPEGASARIWLPVAATNEDQTVAVESKEAPDGGKIATDKYGNHIFYVAAKPGADGSIPLTFTYRVTRREVKGPTKGEESAELLARYLQPDRRVPIEGKPLELIQGKELPKDPTASARVFYDLINGHMKYEKKGTGWGNGDSVWACENGYGNCTDFHSLFLSLARSRKIPAKFEIGFPLPPKRGAGDIPGYHCWAKFQAEGKGWLAVDISEANKNPALKDYYFGNLTEDRVTFSTGRDLELTPKQDGEPLNYFVYPYVEVEGKPYPADKVQRQFRFQDIAADAK